MNYFGWKKVKKEITLKSILGETYVQFAPKTVNMDLDIEMLYKNPKQVADMDISIKHIDFRIAKKNYPGELFVESGQNLIALCMLYTSLHHQGTSYTFVEDVLIGDDDYVCAKELSHDKNEQYEQWAAKLEDKINRLVDSGLVENLDEICEQFANMKVTSEVYEIVYVGPTKTINYSGDMTIGEFSEMIIKEFNIIPVFLYKGVYKVIPKSTKLEEIGVYGEKTLDVKIKMDVSSLGGGLQEQNDLDAYVGFKYVKRPWAFIEDSTFDEVEILPSFFKSIGWTLLVRFTYKYIDRID